MSLEEPDLVAGAANNEIFYIAREEKEKTYASRGTHSSSKGSQRPLQLFSLGQLKLKR